MTAARAFLFGAGGWGARCCAQMPWADDGLRFRMHSECRRAMHCLQQARAPSLVEGIAAQRGGFSRLVEMGISRSNISVR